MINAPTSIIGCIKRYAEDTPDKICLIEALSGRTITYSEFWKRILAYAGGVRPKKNYILRTHQTINHMIAFYGIQAAGSVAIPVEEKASDEKIKELANSFTASIIQDDEIINEKGIEYVEPDPEKLACVICTTGTTGKNKGVMSSFRCRYFGADNVRHSYDITSDDTALVPQVLSHSGGLRRVEAMLVSGATAVIMGAVMLFGNIFGAIKKYNCNVLQFVPAQVSQILERAEKLLIDVAPQLRIISVGSAVITEHDKERLRELLPGVRLFNDFGSTEAIGSAFFEWSKYPQKSGCVGTASIHSKIVFLDEKGDVLEKTSKDCPGIIATEGGTLMSGYLNAPDLTEVVMKDGRVISSDLGYLGDDGLIYILGRKDDIIVCGANKVSPAEIEEVAMGVPGIKECACVPKEDKSMGHMPALFVVCEDSGCLDAMSREFERKLEPFKIPRAENIYVIDKLPRTVGTGKVLRRELMERL